MTMTTTDRAGNNHRGGGSPEGGQFTGRGNPRPDGALAVLDEEPDWEWQPTRYRIPTANLGALRERLDRANKRLARAGVDERFTFTAERRLVHDERTGETYSTNDVTLNVPRITCGEWAFDGVHELGANGQVISHFTHGAEAVLDESKDLLVCEHCGHRRARTKVIVVTNPKTGETKQVGTNCLDLFLGVKPEGIWALTEDFDASELAVDDDDLGAFRSTSSSIMDADDVLALTLQVMTEDGGYLSKSKAGYHEVPTATKVLERLDERAAVHPQITDEERAELDEVLAYVDSINPADADDYESNLRAALAKDRDGNRRVSRKHVPLVASAISSHRRNKSFALKRQLEDEARTQRDSAKVQEFLAASGEKLTGRNIEATVLSIRMGRDYGYGAPLHVSLIDDDGHVIYWKASGPVGGSIQTPGGLSVNWTPSDGARVVIASGTVKDNRVSEYNGDWETVITRAKLQPTAETFASWDERAPWLDEDDGEGGLLR